MNLTRSIVENHSFSIDGLSSTGDWAKVNGRTFINKSPGTSFLAVPVYFVVHLFTTGAFNSFIGGQVATHLTIAFSISLFSALATVMLFLLMRRFASDKAAVFAAAIYSLGTFVLSYSSLFNAGIVVASCYVTVFYAMWKWKDRPADDRQISPWLFLAGFFTAWAIVTEPTAIIGGVLAAALLIAERAKLRHWASFIVGGIGPGLLLAFYNHQVTGEIFSTAYKYENPEFISHEAFMGVFQAPSLQVLYNITFGPVRGLFYGSPVLIVFFAGIFFMARKKEAGKLAVLTVCMTGYYLLFNCAFINWHAGHCISPRYLTPALPFFVIPMVFLFHHRVYRIVAYFLGAISVGIQLMIAAVNPQMPPVTKFPLTEYVIPILFKFGSTSVNNQAITVTKVANPLVIQSWQEFWASYNLGELIGLHGFVSLTPLLVLWLAAGVGLIEILRRSSDQGR